MTNISNMSVVATQNNPNLTAIEDELVELRSTNAVIESYAQLVTRLDDQQAISMQQIGDFLFIMNQKQNQILNKIEACFQS